jgi:hypothetical protein
VIVSVRRSYVRARDIRHQARISLSDLHDLTGLRPHTILRDTPPVAHYTVFLTSAARLLECDLAPVDRGPRPTQARYTPTGFTHGQHPPGGLVGTESALSLAFVCPACECTRRGRDRKRSWTPQRPRPAEHSDDDDALPALRPACWRRLLASGSCGRDRALALWRHVYVGMDCRLWLSMYVRT